MALIHLESEAGASHEQLCDGDLGKLSVKVLVEVAHGLHQQKRLRDGNHLSL
jgi:hypothetical protein